MKTKAQLNDIIQLIASDQSPVGMDAVYVHALILDKLQLLQTKLETIERRLGDLEGSTDRTK
jgi:hypothetical protein